VAAGLRASAVERLANNAPMTPPQTSQPDASRFLPRPAALRVVDDAGAAHRHDVPLIWFLWIVREADPVSRGIRRQQMMTAWDQSMGVVMGVLVGAIMVGVRTLSLPDHLMLIFAVVIGSLLAWVMWWSAHRRIETHWESLGRQWTDAGLGRGRCPLCLYSLAGVRPDDRGLAQCAECGAAWRQDRIGQRDEREPPRWRRAMNAMIGADTRRAMQDDRGRAFAAERLNRIAARCERRQPHVAAIARRVRASGATARVLAAAAIGAVFFLPVVMLLRMMGRVSVALPPWILLALPVFVIPAALLIGVIGCSELGLSARSRRRQMLEAGLCPVCASTDLRPPEEDAAACGGCGASWRRAAGPGMLGAGGH
jgi:hypothetical protein